MLNKKYCHPERSATGREPREREKERAVEGPRFPFTAHSAEEPGAPRFRAAKRGITAVEQAAEGASMNPNSSLLRPSPFVLRTFRQLLHESNRHLGREHHAIFVLPHLQTVEEFLYIRICPAHSQIRLDRPRHAGKQVQRVGDLLGVTLGSR